MEDRSCEECHRPLEGKRRDSRWCNRACRARWKRKQKRLAAYREQAGQLLGVHPVESPKRRAAFDEAADRFRLSLALDQAERVPQARHDDWDAWERRNPGVAHPGRVQETIEGQARADSLRLAGIEYKAPQNRFGGPSDVIAQAGKRARERNRRATPAQVPQGPYNAAGEWDIDGEPEPAEMVSGGPFRGGYRHASYDR